MVKKKQETSCISQRILCFIGIANKADYVYNVNYALEGSYTEVDGSDGDLKAIFRPATLLVLTQSLRL